MTTATRNVALGAVAAGLAIALGAGRRRRRDVTADRAHVSRTVTVRCDAQRAYDAWASNDGLRAFVRGIDAVTFELVLAAPPNRIEWRFAPRGALRGGAAVSFAPAPGERGTEARFSLNLTGPRAKTAARFAQLFGCAPAQVAAESLRAFKALVEAGEVPRAVRA
jgi:uncharacterized membrane protein